MNKRFIITNKRIEKQRIKQEDKEKKAKVKKRKRLLKNVIRWSLKSSDNGHTIVIQLLRKFIMT